MHASPFETKIPYPPLLKGEHAGLCCELDIVPVCSQNETTGSDRRFVGYTAVRKNT